MAIATWLSPSFTWSWFDPVADPWSSLWFWGCLTPHSRPLPLLQPFIVLIISKCKNRNNYAREHSKTKVNMGNIWNNNNWHILTFQDSYIISKSWGIYKNIAHMCHKSTISHEIKVINFTGINLTNPNYKIVKRFNIHSLVHNRTTSLDLLL